MDHTARPAGLARLVAAAGIAAALLALPAAPVAAQAKPNFVFVNLTHLRQTGIEQIQTPFLDRLASQGVRFTDAHVQYTYEGGSRPTVDFGVRPDTHGIAGPNDAYYGNRALLGKTMFDYLKQNGYIVASVNTVYYGAHEPRVGEAPGMRADPNLFMEVRDPQNAGFVHPGPIWKPATEWPGYGFARSDMPLIEGVAAPDANYPDAAIAVRTAELLRALKNNNKPFAVFVAFRQMHAPIASPKRFWDMYPPAGITLPANYGMRPMGIADVAIDTNQYWRGSFSDYPSNNIITLDYAKQIIQCYRATASFLDNQLGRIVTAVDNLALGANTYVMAWSDSGFQLGEHGLWDRKDLFRHNSRVPLVVRGPGVVAGGKVGGFVETVDIYPTVSELAGLAVPTHLEGTSFTPLLQRPDLPWKRAVFSQYRRGGGEYPNLGVSGRITGRSILTATHRYDEWKAETSGQIVARTLFDLRVDPDENRNLAADPGQAAVVAELSATLAAGWRAALPPPVTSAPDGGAPGDAGVAVADGGAGAAGAGGAGGTGGSTGDPGGGAGAGGGPGDPEDPAGEGDEVAGCACEVGVARGSGSAVPWLLLALALLSRHRRRV